MAQATVTHDDSVPDKSAVRSYLLGLQQRITDALEIADGGEFRRDVWTRTEGGGGESRVLAEGAVLERAGVGFSHIEGAGMPGSASSRRPDMVGAPFEAMGVSVILHPRNPHVPAAHANVRFLIAAPKDRAPIWWFGGGFDLTPFYPVMQDVLHWHRTARAACEPFGHEVYPRYKAWCDRYFYLQHRNETRGVGGLFFDDLHEWGFDRSFGFMRSVGDSFLSAYLPILQRRKAVPYTDEQRAFQLYRRGRYVEFNLVYDRGTLFGLQSGGRIESILMSMPPVARWDYDWQPIPGSPEARLYDEFLQPRDYLTESESGNS